MSFRRALGLAFVAALTACQGSCSCGSSSDDGDGAGGETSASTGTVTSGGPTSTGATTTAVGTGGEGAGVTSAGGAGQGGDPTSAGGAGQGGDSTSNGGAGQGGTGQGGSGGDASGGGGSGGGTLVAERECEVAADCQLVDDCCTCDAIPANETPEECLAVCVQSTCSGQQRGDDAAVACLAGRCVAGFDCNWNLATCDSEPPACDPGFTASLIDGCWGPCVLATECNSVGSCDQCDGGLGCVEQAAFGSSYHCVTDAPCAVDDCSCLGPSVCEDGSEICIEDDDDDVVVCECIVC